MKKLIPLFLALIFYQLSFAQQELYSRAEIQLGSLSVEELAATGIDLTHGIWQGRQSFTSEFSATEIEQIRAAGFQVDILIEDLQAHILRQNSQVELRAPADSCDAHFSKKYPYATPEHFELGSMGGFYTYEEMLAQLDAMAEEYPHLISARQPIEGFRTHEDRPIYWMRLSDNPNTEEDEPEGLYTALHHAREPNSLTQLIFFMWYVLENYDNDPEIRDLVDNTEFYFLPCLNPDGYIYNQTTNPDGGGFWRKNRRQNGDGSYGVDLNRNYGYEWASGNGSSGNTNSQTYHGPEAFSEPETQAIRAFCLDHDFKVALNYHTFSDVLIYPWTYSSQVTPDNEAFSALAAAMTQQNGYGIGTIFETLGYLANGTSDDWMYGEQAEKNKIFAMTPEVGQSFWPEISRIEENSLACMQMNLMAARAVHDNYAKLDYPQLETVSQQSFPLEYQLQRIGQQSGNFILSLAPLTANATVSQGAINAMLGPWQGIDGRFQIELAENITDGKIVGFALVLDNGQWARTDTLRWIYRQPELGLFDSGTNLDGWDTGEEGWGLATEEYFSAPSAFADSPLGNYDFVTDNYLRLNRQYEVVEPAEARLTFMAQWEMSSEPDYAQVRLSVNGGPFFALCGKYTRRLYFTTNDWTPAYMNRVWPWVQEEISLAPYVSAGDSIAIEFVMSSGGGSADGIYIDDIFLDLGGDGLTGLQELGAADFISISAFPNPAKDRVVVQVKNPQEFSSQARLLAYNSLGQQMAELPLARGGNTGEYHLTLNVEGWSPGLYVLQIWDGKQLYGRHKLAVSK